MSSWIAWTRCTCPGYAISLRLATWGADYTRACVGVTCVGVARYPAVNLLGAFDQQALHDAGVNTSAIDWQIPKFSDVVMQFDTEADMDTYCSARDYATTPSTTPLLMGVVFDSFGFTDNEWAYRIRLNSSSTPSTSGSQMNTFARQADVFSLLQYFGADQTVSGSMSQFSNTPGFAQVQTALDRAIINKQGPASSADSRATDLVSAMIVATIINANTPARTIFVRSLVCGLWTLLRRCGCGGVSRGGLCV